MVRGILLSIIILLLAVTGGIVYFVRSSSDVDENEEVMQKTDGMDKMEAKKESDGKFLGTIEELLKSNSNVTCTFEYTDDAGNNTLGTVYLADQGDLMRGDFLVNTVSSEDSIEASMIRDGEYAYTWSNAFDNGVKIKLDLDKEEVDTPETPNSSDTITDFEDREVEYDCDSWAVDNSMFELPENIEFQEFNTQIDTSSPALPENLDDIKANPCLGCEQVQDDTAKAQCLEALNCPTSN